jgi:hypothetical protein
MIGRVNRVIGPVSYAMGFGCRSPYHAGGQV